MEAGLLFLNLLHQNKKISIFISTIHIMVIIATDLNLKMIKK